MMTVMTTMMNRITHPKDRILRCLDHAGEDRADARRGWVGIDMRSHGGWGRLREEVAVESDEAAVGRRRRRRRWRRRILKGRVHHDVVIGRWCCYIFSGGSNLCALGRLWLRMRCCESSTPRPVLFVGVRRCLLTWHRRRFPFGFDTNFNRLQKRKINFFLKTKKFTNGQCRFLSILLSFISFMKRVA